MFGPCRPPTGGNNVLCVAFVSASRQTRLCRLRAHRGSTMPAPCRRRDTIMPAPCRRRDTITRMMPAPCRRRDTLHQNPLYQITVLVAGQSGSCRKVGTAMCVGSYPYLLALVFFILPKLLQRVCFSVFGLTCSQKTCIWSEALRRPSAGGGCSRFGHGPRQYGALSARSE